jgi:hypothetical protein
MLECVLWFEDARHNHRLSARHAQFGWQEREAYAIIDHIKSSLSVSFRLPGD